jgi:ribonucleoside-diphosphate reductase beta chain
MGDPYARNKIGYLLEEVDSPMVKVAVFSGAAEGVALFSSFAVLLSYNLDSRFKGLSMIISWSILDEQQHSDMGIRLFSYLLEEEGICTQELNQIKDGFAAVVANEVAFLDNVFGDTTTINGVRKEAFVEFIKMRANERFSKLGLEEGDLFPVDLNLAREVSDWFAPLANGNVSADFFSTAKEGSQYISKSTFSCDNVNLSTLSLESNPQW